MARGQATGDAGDAQGLDAAAGGSDRAAWNRLRDQVRRGVRAGSAESFDAEQQEAIRGYYRRLAEEQKP